MMMENKFINNIMRLVVLASMLAIVTHVQVLLSHAFLGG
jgi:hypothetical protein